MAKNNQIEGQLTFNMCFNDGNYVCQSNTLIGGKQALKLNSAKIIRAAIMQIVKEDQELKTYKISISELAKLLNISTSNIYRDIEDITDDIIQNPVFIKMENKDSVAWIKIPWVTRCEYNSNFGLAIKLNDELKPYLLNLKDHYTQYTLENLLSMNSIYGVRIFEIIQSKIMRKIIPKDGLQVSLTVEELRESCDCTDKYVRFSHFRTRVLDSAVKEINNKTLYVISYDYVKERQKVVEIIFNINMSYH